MKNLGKLIIILLMSVHLLAEVKVSVDRTQVKRGEQVTFTLSVSGTGEVKLPPLDRICGYDIESRMQSRKDIFLNGKQMQELSLIYTFTPERSCVIEPIHVAINGKDEMTTALKVNVSNKVTISKNDPFIVKLSTDKKSVYVGEPFEMNVIFKTRKNIDTLSESISLKDSKNIWIKSEYKGRTFLQNNYIVRKNMYALAAQQSGELTLGPLRWDIEIRAQARDFWGTWVATSRTKRAFSNEEKIEIKPLPKGISLVGELGLDVKVDKTKVKAGEAVNLTVEVKGHANVEDVEPFDINIAQVQAFSEDPKVTHSLKDGRYFGSFIQKSALVADRNFTIPSLELRYMDVKTDTIKTVRSEPINITVINSAPVMKEKLNISRPDETNSSKGIEGANSTYFITNIKAILILIGGFALGVIFMLIPWRRVFKKGESKNRVSLKDSKEILRALMGHIGEDNEIEDLVQSLSENIYEGKNNKIDKKRVKEILKRLQEE